MVVINKIYPEQFSSQSSHATFIGIGDEQDTEAPCVTSDELRMASQDMTGGKWHEKIE